MMIKYMKVNVNEAMKIMAKILKCNRIEVFSSPVESRLGFGKELRITGHRGDRRIQLSRFIHKGEDVYLTTKRVYYPVYITLPIPGVRYVTGTTKITKEEMKRIKENCYPTYFWNKGKDKDTEAK